MLKFDFQIDPWEQVRYIKINTLFAYIELKEDEEYVTYEHNEFGRYESVEYKFRLRKRPNYKEYIRDFIQFDVDVIDLKNLTGVMSYFREVYQYVVSLYRRGTIADLTFKWHDKDVHVSFGLHVARGGEGAEILNVLTAEYGSEYVKLHHSEKVESAEDELERHVKEAIGLYLLFKEYILQEGELSKT
jgi:hypothetical protein